MSKQAFNARLEALESLRTHPDPEAARQQLRKALKDRNNYLVGRAAAIAADLHFDELMPELLSAFDRFMVDPARSDPHCLAKTAIASALRELGHHGAPVYLRGITHIQLEPAWGGRADTAAGLRGTCALALVDCVLDDLEILTYLTDALADQDKTVRIDAARAIEQLNRAEGGLLLRLKALIGDPDPDVMGQCFSSMLSLAPSAVVAFISRFLKSPSEDVQLEAASALAQCRDPEAVKVLHEYWQDPLVSLEVRQALLINLGASPLPEAIDFLLSVVSREPVALAGTAVGALASSRFQHEIRERLAAAIEERDSGELRMLFEKTFGGTPVGR
jgi:HEAT repeat protein